MPQTPDFPGFPDPDRLYMLLPAVYRQRDMENGEPLRALLQIIAEQVALVEDDITRLYDNWFIETCDDWVVPYIADLIGYVPVHEAGSVTVEGGTEDPLRNRILIPRREVANTIANRRRKGTLALLDGLAGDVTGWPARAVEFSRLLAGTQALAHPQPGGGRTLDLRDGSALDQIGGPFDARAHLADMHRRGRYSPDSVGLFAWRRGSYSVTLAPAFPVPEAGPHCFRFSALGQDVPLHIRPVTLDVPTEFPDELEAPVPIRRRFLEERIVQNSRASLGARAALYGDGKSLAVYFTTGGPPGLVVPTLIRSADLSGWRHRLEKGQVAIDPVLGRLMLAPGATPGEVLVRYHYGFGAEMGGGEYPRTLPPPEGSFYCVGRDQEFANVGDAYARWQADSTGSAVIEIADSGVYAEHFSLTLPQDHRLALRAANGCRPVLRPLDKAGDHADYFEVRGEAGSALTLDGLVITGHALEVKGEASLLTLNHCTLVPGRELDPDGMPQGPADPSLRLCELTRQVMIDHCILGPIQTRWGGGRAEPMQITLQDSILDALSPDRDALTGLSGDMAHALLSVRRVTVFGGLRVHAVLLAENSLFTGAVQVARRQVGCLRFCYAPPGSRTPPRFHCQPDGVGAKLSGARLEEEQERVAPQFLSDRYGRPAYAQLALTGAPEIARGADDESEMGAFHDLFQPQRAANLQARLEEYTPARVQVEIIYAD